MTTERRAPDFCPVAPDDEPSRLARAFQAGDRSVLARLHEALRPQMAVALARYRDRPGALPSSLERGDLAQESWLILAELAERWRPAGGSFAAYFRVSFPWELARYVQHHSPSRRARGIRVLGSDLPDVQGELDEHVDVDGREWDGEVVWSELIEPLTEREQAVLLLHLAHQKPFAEVARALRMTRPAAFRLYRRALKRVQGSSIRVGQRTVFLDAAILNLERQGELIGLVRTLHAQADENGCLPGRNRLKAETGLSQDCLARLLSLLAEAGCIRSRRPRKAGSLVQASPEETLAVLGVQPAEAP